MTNNSQIGQILQVLDTMRKSIDTINEILTENTKTETTKDSSSNASHYEGKCSTNNEIKKTSKRRRISKRRKSTLNVSKEILPKEEKKNKQKEKRKKEKYSFEDFWNVYDKKIGKPKSLALWNKLKSEEKERAVEHFPFYKNRQPEKQYRKHPERYLRDKVFDDEDLQNYKTKETFKPINTPSYIARQGVLPEQDKSTCRVRNAQLPSFMKPYKIKEGVSEEEMKERGRYLLEEYTAYQGLFKDENRRMKTQSHTQLLNLAVVNGFLIDAGCKPFNTSHGYISVQSDEEYGILKAKLLKELN